MPRWNEVDVAGAGVDLRTVVHREAHPSRDQVSEVRLLAASSLAGVLGPPPARFEGRPVEGDLAQADHVDAAALELAALVDGVEALDVRSLGQRARARCFG